MALIDCAPGSWRFCGAAAAVGVGLLASACALVPGEFAQTSFEPLVLTGAHVDNAAGTPVSLQPAVVAAVNPQLHQPPPLPSPSSAGARTAPAQPATTRSASATGGNPGASRPPAEPTSTLLSPEEKARVVAELEALAASQGAALSASRKECDEAAADELKPAERLKRDLNVPEC